MRFWVREIAGWLSILLGLFGFFVCFTMLLSPARQILEAGPITLISVVLFRGGIHLLKVATAARICLQTQDRLAEELAAKETKRAGSKNHGYAQRG